MKKYTVKVKGITPYMQHRMDLLKLAEWEKFRGTIIERDGLNTPPEKTAAFHSYINNDGEYFIPTEHFKQCFVNASKMVKGKVGTASRSMKSTVAGMWFVRPNGESKSFEEIPFRKFDMVDVRTAVNAKIKGRIVTHRPRWQDWGVTFELHIDNDTLTVETISEIIRIGGSNIGVGSYRPEHTGEFGRFELVELKEIK